MTSGSDQPHCSASSNPIVFIPSTRYGSRSVATGHHPDSAAYAAAILPASPMCPSMRHELCAQRVDGVENGTRRRARREDPHRQAGRRRVRREGGAGVAGRRHDEPRHAIALGARHGGAHAARLERAGGILRFVLDAQATHTDGTGQRRRLDERGEPLTECDRRLAFVQRQPRPVAPHVPAGGQHLVTRDRGILREEGLAARRAGRGAEQRGGDGAAGGTGEGPGHESWVGGVRSGIASEGSTVATSGAGSGGSGSGSERNRERRRRRAPRAPCARSPRRSRAAAAMSLERRVAHALHAAEAVQQRATSGWAPRRGSRAARR